MSAKTTGMIWDLDLSVPQRMVLLAMVDHADHDGEHIHAPTPFIAWKTGYSARNVYRITQDLVDAGLLVITGGALGEAYEYRFDLSRGALKAPYRGPKPKRKAATPDKMTRVSPDKMARGRGATPDKMASPPDILAGGTPDILAIDKESTLYKDHDRSPPPSHPHESNGGGDVLIEQEPPNGKPKKTELYYWMLDFGVKSPAAAARNQHHDPEPTKAMFLREIGDAKGAEREKRIGRVLKMLSEDGPRSPPRPAPPPAVPAPPVPRERSPDANDRIATARKLKAMAPTWQTSTPMEAQPDDD